MGVSDSQLIREHMAEVDGETPLDGDVEAAETSVGSRRHRGGRGYRKNKVVVFGMVDAMATLWPMR